MWQRAATIPATRGDYTYRHVTGPPNTPHRLCCKFRKYECSEKLMLDAGLSANENCALLGYYAASSGNFLPTFRDCLSVPSSRVSIIYRSNRAGSPKKRIIGYSLSVDYPHNQNKIIFLMYSRGGGGASVRASINLTEDFVVVLIPFS